MWLCCFRPSLPEREQAAAKPCKAQSCASPSPPQCGTAPGSSGGNSLEEPSVPRPLHAPSGRYRKGSQQGLQLSEDTVLTSASASLKGNPLAFFLPVGSDEHDQVSSGRPRLEPDAFGNGGAGPSGRGKVDFVDLCASLEQLVYLGEGSNGIVYRALWHGAKVAVKFMLGNNDDSQHLQRCFTEAVLTRVLSHPCVVQCFATAMAQLTPELWEAIRTRCQRQHTNVMPSSAMSRSAMVGPSTAQTGGSSGEEPQQRSSQQQQQQQQQPSRVQTPPHQAQSRLSRPEPPLTPRRDGTHGNLTAAPSQPQQPHALPSTPSIRRSREEQEALDRQKLESFFADESPSLELCNVGEPSGADGDESDGISLLQALQDLKAEPGRCCTMVVMEYMEAGTLHTAITHGEYSARRVAEHRSKLLALLITAQELAQGMAHLHALDILHGDLKPTNILLKGSPCQYVQTPGGGGGGSGSCGESGSSCGPMAGQAAGGGGGAAGLLCTDPRGYTAKIADLGLARTCPGSECAELTSDQWGALAYLAPEAAKGSVCKASDVYSFGVMLWEMAAGVRPYLGLTTPQVLMGLVTGTLQLTWPSDGSIYGPLRSLGVACTDPVPGERPTFDVAARILARMVRHVRIAAEPLRERHSSALSMEVVPGGGGAGGSSCSGSPKPPALKHASRSVPMGQWPAAPPPQLPQLQLSPPQRRTPPQPALPPPPPSATVSSRERSSASAASTAAAAVAGGAWVGDSAAAPPFARASALASGPAQPGAGAAQSLGASLGLGLGLSSGPSGVGGSTGWVQSPAHFARTRMAVTGGGGQQAASPRPGAAARGPAAAAAAAVALGPMRQQSLQQ